MTRPLAASFLLVLLALLTACDAGPDKHRLTGSTMGTVYSITLVETDETTARALEAEVAGELLRINDIFSTYIEDSELNRLNRHPVGEAFRSSEELYAVLAMSQEIYQRSGGLFDPSVGPVVDLWGFGPELRPDRAPDNRQLAEAQRRVGFDGLALDPEARTVTRTRDLVIDLSAIAKGYGADLLARLLESRGIDRYMVDIGGDLRIGGLNPHNTEWRIAVEQPSVAVGDIAAIMTVSDRGIATSGDYRNYFEEDGQRFSHTIDPRTGYPISHELASVTVIAPEAALADGWATAFMVAGADQALLIAEREDIPVYLLVKVPDGFEVRHNTAFAPYMQAVTREAE